MFQQQSQAQLAALIQSNSAPHSKAVHRVTPWPSHSLAVDDAEPG
jgi:hypothetical protein